MSTLEPKTEKPLVKRLVEDFIDIVILKNIRKKPEISGYDIIKLLYTKFHMLSSPGTIYSILYSLERQNLILGTTSQRKRVYKLTARGETFLRSCYGRDDQIHAVLASILSEA